MSALASPMKKLSPCADHVTASGSWPSISASLRGKVLPFPPLLTLPLLAGACGSGAAEGAAAAVAAAVAGAVVAAVAAAPLQELLRLRRALRVMVTEVKRVVRVLGRLAWLGAAGTRRAAPSVLLRQGALRNDADARVLGWRCLWGVGGVDQGLG